VIVNDVSNRAIDEALIGKCVVFVTVQNKTTVPENLSNLTSSLSKPDPIPDSVPLALMCPPKIDSVPITEIPPVWLRTVPMPEPKDELLAVIFPLTIVRFPIVEMPLEVPRPVPMPELKDELLAVIFPFAIVRFPIAEVLFKELYAVPMPEP
jgi:hypothetical protein